MPPQTPSISTSGKLSATSLCFRVKSLARRRRSKPSPRRSLQHRCPLRKPHRRLSSTPGTPCRPCRLSWISGGSRRTYPKGKASAIDRSGGRRRSTSRQRMPRSATSSRYPHSQSSSRASWPRRFNANTLPQYDGDYDPKEFLMKFEAAVESNGGDATTKAKALVLALKGGSVLVCKHTEGAHNLLVSVAKQVVVQFQGHASRRARFQ
jgi:hypothetical protein